MAAVTFLVFARCLQHDFVDWDDVENFTRNPLYRGLGWSQLTWMWTTPVLGHYIPVTWMTLGLDYLVWGMDPAGYHLSNILVHTASAVLVYLVALRLLRHADAPDAPAHEGLARALAAAFAALTFAVHPLRVESVAWVTERRDVVSGLFYLLAVLAYLRDAAAPPGTRLARRRWYWMALGCFVLASLSKSMSLTLPLVLIVIDVSGLGRVGDGPGGWSSPEARRRWLEKLPFLAVSLVVAAVTVGVMARLEALTPMAALGLLDRLAITAHGLAFYLWKTVWPLGLSPFYPQPIPVAPLSARYVLAGGVVVALTGVAVAVRRRWPAVGVAWLVYVITLLPVSGLFQNGPQAVADRYSYLASLPLATLAAAALLRGRRALRQAGRGRVAGVSMASVGVLAVLALSMLTWRQAGIWQNSEKLWTHATATVPSALAQYHLGDLRREQSRWEDAAEHYRLASSLPATRDDLERIHLHWGLALSRQGRQEEAIEHYRETVRVAPNNANAHYNWGNALFVRGRTEEAIDQYRVAAHIRPDFAEAYNNWGRALAEQGHWAEAIQKYRQALRIKPDYSRAAANLEEAMSKAR